MANYIKTLQDESGNGIYPRTRTDAIYTPDGEALSAESIGAAVNVKDGSATGSVRTVGAKQNIGEYAFAEGLDTKASGLHSHAEGFSTNAMGADSHAEGCNTTALKNYSHAEGGSTSLFDTSLIIGADIDPDSSGRPLSSIDRTAVKDAWENTKFSLAGDLYSHVEGRDCLALGINSHAEGYRTTASGESSHAEGCDTVASGPFSHAGGYGTVASGHLSYATGYETSAADYSFACGSETQAKEGFSFVTGSNNVAKKYQTVVGKHNKEYEGFASGEGTETSSSTAVSVFMVGIGSSATPKNGMRVTGYGKIYGCTSYASSGADFAEYFEWQDGNPDNEDRRGYFVTLDGDKIRIATPEDDYILGVISSTPTIEGNAWSEQWQGMELRNVFGDMLTEEVVFPETVNESTGEVTPAHTETRPILNPEYDPNKEYIPRELRKEWSPVGLVGQLVVVDDGTCEANKYCKVGEEGNATVSDERTQYRVMKRLDDTHILVFIK